MVFVVAPLIPKYMDHTQASLLDHREVARYLESDLKFGLATSEVQARLKRFGLNKLEAPLEGDDAKSAGIKFYLRKLARHLAHPLVQMLLIGALVSLSLGFYEHSATVGASIMLVCVVSHFQERHADRALEELSLQVPSTCQVIRDRQLMELESELLVPGDIVHLHEGQRVPADVRLFDAHALEIDESNLTQDSKPRRKCVEPLAAPVRAEVTRKSVRFFSDLELASASMSSSTSGYSSTSGIVEEQLSSSSAGTSGDVTASDSTVTSVASDVTATSIEVVSEKAKEEKTTTPETLKSALVLQHSQTPEVRNTCAMYQNLSFMGARVETGRSMGVVIATGKSTRYSTEVYQQLKGARNRKSPLQTQLDELALNLLVSGYVIIALVSGVALVVCHRRHSSSEVFAYAITLGALVTPAGLPVVVMNERTREGIVHKCQNFLTFQLSISLACLLLLGISYALNIATPLNIVHLLYLKLVIDGPPAHALATWAELSEHELEELKGCCCKLTGSGKRILNCQVLGTTFVLTCTLVLLNGGLYAFLYDDQQGLDGRARALLFSCFLFCTIFASLGLKSRTKTVYETRLHGNKQLLVCCALMTLVQLLIVLIGGPVNEFFALEPVRPLELLYVFAYASIVLIAMDSLKLFVRFLDYGRQVLLKAAANLQVPTGREGSYSTKSATSEGQRRGQAKARRLSSDMLGATNGKGEAPARCMAITPLATPSAASTGSCAIVATLPTRTLFGNTFRSK